MSRRRIASSLALATSMLLASCATTTTASMAAGGTASAPQINVETLRDVTTLLGVEVVDEDSRVGALRAGGLLGLRGGEAEVVEE